MTQIVWSEEPTVFAITHIDISAIRTIFSFFSAPSFLLSFISSLLPILSLINSYIFNYQSNKINTGRNTNKKNNNNKISFPNIPEHQQSSHCNHLSSEPFRSFPPTHTLHIALRKKKKYVKGLLMGFISGNHSHTHVNYRSIQPQTNRDHYF